MNELINVNNEFTVDDKSGEAYISQRACERLTGIPQSTIQRWVTQNNGSLYNTNENNQLDAKSLQNLVFSGHSTQCYPMCEPLLQKLMEAGAKAFIYHQAGYQFDAAPKQLTPAEALLASAQQLVDHEKRLGQIEHEQGKTMQLVEDHLVKAEYFTIGMFAKERGLQLSMGEAISKGAQASKRSHQAGYTVETFRDWQNRPRKHYHEDVLNEIFQG